ncbi:hypothetical protein CTAYLR_005966 [Chrysophaeum taylorii]|uniref:PH domain-containing protein n=1 Tax=Chrysophaeum taylorii TaxID=2483200 RepID=A0AAD7UIT1_9STRA|nr:hypothetical protein CTAYLR_005966 [Chrysophaeum taylorii]
MASDIRALAAMPDPYAKEGFLEKQGRGRTFKRHTPWQLRKFQLDPAKRELVYSADGHTRGSVSVAGCVVAKEPAKRFAFSLTLVAGDVLLLCAHDEADRLEWIAAIESSAKWDEVQAARKQLGDEERAAREAAELAQKQAATDRKEAAVRRAREAREKALEATQKARARIKADAPATSSEDANDVLATAVNAVAVAKYEEGLARKEASVVTRGTGAAASTATTKEEEEEEAPPLVGTTLQAELDKDEMKRGMRDARERAAREQEAARLEAAAARAAEEAKLEARAADIRRHRDLAADRSTKEAAAHDALEKQTMVHKRDKGEFDTRHKEMNDLIHLGDAEGGAASTIEDKLDRIRRDKGKVHHTARVVAPKDPYPEDEGWL